MPEPACNRRPARSASGRKCVAMLVAALLAASTLQAQFNDTVTHFVSVQSTGTYNRTNQNRSFVISNIASFSQRQKPVTFNVNAKWLYGRQDGKLVNQDITGVADVNYYTRGARLYYWGLLTANSIYSMRINLQLQGGGGLAYNLVDTRIFNLNVSDGLLYDYSDIYLKTETREVYRTPRNSFRLQARLHFSDRFSLYHATYFQNSLQYGYDWIVRSETELALRVFRLLSLTSRLAYSKYNRTEKETLFFTYGLSLSRYF